jgi:cytidylate kinase
MGSAGVVVKSQLLMGLRGVGKTVLLNRIAELMGLKVERTGPLCRGLIRKGMVWSSAHGMTAFTVPMFDAFMRRAMAR